MPRLHTLTAALALSALGLFLSPAEAAQPGLARPIMLMAAAAAAPTPAAALDLAAQGYKAYLRAEAGQLEAFTRQLTDAIKLNKLEDAQKLYSATHVHYERIRAVAQQSKDLDKALNAPAGAFEKKGEDPAFTGYHRIEKALFADKTTAPVADLADKLLADVLQLNKLFTDLEVTPATLVASAQGQIEVMKASLAAGGTEPYAGTDLDDLQAEADGAASALVVLRPALGQAQAQLLDQVDGQFLTLNQLLRSNREAAGGQKPLSAISTADLDGLKAAATALDEALGKLKATLAP